MAASNRASAVPHQRCPNYIFKQRPRCRTAPPMSPACTRPRAAARRRRAGRKRRIRRAGNAGSGRSAASGRGRVGRGRHRGAGTVSPMRQSQPGSHESEAMTRRTGGGCGDAECRGSTSRLFTAKSRARVARSLQPTHNRPVRLGRACPPGPRLRTSESLLPSGPTSMATFAAFSAPGPAAATRRS